MDLFGGRIEVSTTILDTSGLAYMPPTQAEIVAVILIAYTDEEILVHILDIIGFHHVPARCEFIVYIISGLGEAEPIYLEP